MNRFMGTEGIKVSEKRTESLAKCSFRALKWAAGENKKKIKIAGTVCFAILNYK